eukprot:Anaeramoba_flamelloidesa89806_69.p1 GENE.a89806_69~~a89806_69.p1  ORF type:complete len:741 (-),score=188.82 a89806_69:61-2184(-)
MDCGSKILTIQSNIKFNNESGFPLSIYINDKSYGMIDNTESIGIKLKNNHNNLFVSRDEKRNRKAKKLKVTIPNNYHSKESVCNLYNMREKIQYVQCKSLTKNINTVYLVCSVTSELIIENPQNSANNKKQINKKSNTHKSPLTKRKGKKLKRLNEKGKKIIQSDENRQVKKNKTLNKLSIMKTRHQLKRIQSKQAKILNKVKDEEERQTRRERRAVTKKQDIKNIKRAIVSQINFSQNYSEKNYQRFWNIKILDPLIIENLLPKDLEINFYQRNRKSRDNLQSIYYRIASGESRTTHEIPTKTLMEIYISVKVSGFRQTRKFNITNEATLTNNSKYLPITIEDGYSKRIQIQIQNLYLSTGQRKIRFFSRIWLINKTGLPLQYNSEKKTQTIISQVSQYTFNSNDFPTNKDNLKTKIKKYESPVLYSKYKMYFKIPGYDWSEEIDFKKVDTFDRVQISSNRRGIVQLGMEIKNAPSIFHRSLMVTFTPRYFFINKLKNNIEYQWRRSFDDDEYDNDNNYNMDDKGIVLSNKEIPIYRKPRKYDMNLIRIRIQGYYWSHVISIESLDFETIKLYNVKKQTQIIHLNLTTKIDGTTIYIYFEEKNINSPQYLLSNKTNYQFKIWQKGGGRYEILKKNSEQKYYWESPHLKKVLVYHNKLGKVTKEIDFSQDKKLKMEKNSSSNSSSSSTNSLSSSSSSSISFFFSSFK